MKSDIVKEIKINRICAEIIRENNFDFKLFNNLTWIDINGGSVGFFYNQTNEIIIQEEKWSSLVQKDGISSKDDILNNTLNRLLNTEKEFTVKYV